MHPLAPPHFCEAWRHQCILGHFYEQHWPSECHFLDQVRQNKALLFSPFHPYFSHIEYQKHIKSLRNVFAELYCCFHLSDTK